MIGLVFVGLEVLVVPVLLLLLPPLLQAATRQAERMAAALRARYCLESQGG
jgi:energy-coupling factor transporter transmembrane protein EcfT